MSPNSDSNYSCSLVPVPTILTNMDEAQAAEIVMGLRTELAESRRTEENARKRATSLEKLIQGYLELFPGLAVVQLQHVHGSESVGLADTAVVTPWTFKTVVSIPSATPRGQEAVIRVLSAPEFKGRFWTVAMMTGELQTRGWSPDSDHPGTAVRTAMDRAGVVDSHVRKGRGIHGNVVFYYKHDDMPEPRFHDAEVLSVTMADGETRDFDIGRMVRGGDHPELDQG